MRSRQRTTIPASSLLNAHVQSMRNHIATLGAKSYQSQFDEAPD